jgi:hypothetical protein
VVNIGRLNNPITIDFIDDDLLSSGTGSWSKVACCKFLCRKSMSKMPLALVFIQTVIIVPTPVQLKEVGCALVAQLTKISMANDLTRFIESIVNLLTLIKI